MTAIRLENVSVRILKEIRLTIRKGELLVLLGASGAGKSTLLQAIAGLLSYKGQIFFDNARIDRLPPHRRKVGYLFQDLLLFPHLSVVKNLMLAMVHLKRNRRVDSRKALDLLERFNIAHLALRYPRELSGGERQRAALARAIATEPRILLLDEPFSSLDEDNARYLRSELKTHQRDFEITTVFVTHNRQEARELADRIAIMKAGRLLPAPLDNPKVFCREKPDLMNLRKISHLNVGRNLSCLKLAVKPT